MKYDPKNGFGTKVIQSEFYMMMMNTLLFGVSLKIIKHWEFVGTGMVLALAFLDKVATQHGMLSLTLLQLAFFKAY